jgi:hypothetical protein
MFIGKTVIPKQYGKCNEILMIHINSKQIDLFVVFIGETVIPKQYGKCTEIIIIYAQIYMQNIALRTN